MAHAPRKPKRFWGEVEEINLFDEAEVEAKGSALEPVIEVPAHQRRKKQKGHLEQIHCKEHALCWVHARRYFVDAIPAGITQEEAAESISGQAIRKINELFALDKELSH